MAENHIFCGGFAEGSKCVAMIVRPTLWNTSCFAMDWKGLVDCMLENILFCDGFEATWNLLLDLLRQLSQNMYLMLSICNPSLDLQRQPLWKTYSFAMVWKQARNPSLKPRGNHAKKQYFLKWFCSDLGTFSEPKRWPPCILRWF